jgi:hypothetical protein
MTVRLGALGLAGPRVVDVHVYDWTDSPIHVGVSRMIRPTTLSGAALWISLLAVMAGLLWPTTARTQAPDTQGEPQSSPAESEAANADSATQPASITGQAAEGQTENATATTAELPVTVEVVSPKVDPLTDPKLVELKERVQKVLAYYKERRLNTRDHTAWEVMHMVVAYGVTTEIHLDGPGGERQNAMGWLCFNQMFRSGQMLTIENGKPIGVIGVGLQGHQGQLLAYLCQGHLKRDYPMYVAGQKFTIEDLIENEKITCQAGTELTFKLIALAHYLPSDATWKTIDGQQWSIQRLIREEIVQPIQGAACGGTHRLMGLSYAVYKRKKEGKPLEGEFKRANKYMEDYHRYAFQLQNPDGSFSTQWLEYRDARPDLGRRLQTSGHILEWLAFSLPQEALVQADTVRAIDYLSKLLWDNRTRRWEIGPLGHGLHALAIYERRVLKAIPGKEGQATAEGATEGVSTTVNERPPMRTPGSGETTAKPADGSPAAKPEALPEGVIRSILMRKGIGRGVPEPMAEEAKRIIGPRLVPAQPWLQ